MDSETLRRASEVFDAACDRPGEERAAFLDSACAGDPGLRAGVERLLRSDREAGAFLGSPTLGSQGAAPAPGPDEAPGAHVGRYKLLQLIGEGGFGRVFMGEQTEPVVRRVAVKIVKLGMDTRQVIARFEAERQALALMDHPNIARVLDAGATEAGRPYFVMELVRGAPITAHCDRERLGVRDRLRLFVDVCHAVQHAHQKGIIHRDVKPSNVFVSRHDDTAMVKVIDFGIAKAISGRLTDKTLFTEFHQLIGTPAYMSPEQAGLSDLDIDTRSDVYSLGVLLYELLAGVTPFDGRRLSCVGYDEMRRIIREEDPPRPSTRIDTLRLERPAPSTAPARPNRETSAIEIASYRNTDPQSLCRRLRGELDWIVMKCLQKDRSRRYETANALALDVQRYLAGDPVEARRGSRWYVLRKTLRRNRGLCVASVAVAGSLLAGSALAMYGFVQARRERDIAIAARDAEAEQRRHAEAVTELLSGVLGSGGTYRAKGPDYTVGEQLDDVAAALGERSDPPLVEAALRVTIGDHYLRFGVYDKAERHLAVALELRQRALGPEHQLVARVLWFQGELLREKGDYPGAERKFSEALAMQRRLLGNEHLDVADSLNGLGDLLWRRGDLDGAEATAVEVLAIRRKLAGDEDESVADAQHAIAMIRSTRGDLPGAERLFREALATKEELYGPDDQAAAFILHHLADNLRKQGKVAEAEPLARRAVESYRTTPTQITSEPAHAEEVLADILTDTGRLDEAQPLYEGALANRLAIQGADHPVVAEMIHLFGKFLLYRRLDADAAEPQLTEALRIRRKYLGDEHPKVAAVLADWAECLRLRGRLDEAERAARTALGIFRGATGATSDGASTQHATERAHAASILARTLRDTGRTDEAEAVDREFAGAPGR